MYALCIWRCEHARFCVEVFYALYINFHLFNQGSNDTLSDPKVAMTLLVRPQGSNDAWSDPR